MADRGEDGAVADLLDWLIDLLWEREATLKDMARTHADHDERVRLSGKAEGLSLAVSFLHQERRALSNG